MKQILLLLLLLAGACAGPAPLEGLSLIGGPLRRPALPDETRSDLEAKLAAAQADYEAAPADVDAIVWLGRRLAYLGRYREAIEVYTRGLSLHPDNPRLLRHRGHRLITLRYLDRAVTDLTLASLLIRDLRDQPEEDGLPNPNGIPRSTRHSNIWYHLGLAHYLRGDFGRAEAAYVGGQALGEVNDDMLCAHTFWHYLTLRRLGKSAEASALLEAIQPQMEILENNAYHRLLLYFRGDLSREEVLAEAAEGSLDRTTASHGLGALDLIEGRTEEAQKQFRAILTRGSWPAFGYIAAEAEWARWGLGLP